MIQFINNASTWIIVFVLLLNMSQRKIPNTNRKRQATIYLAILFLLFYIGVIVVDTNKAPEWIIYIIGVAVIALGIIFRSKVWPFTLKCKDCHKKLKYDYIIGHDDCLCQDCHDKRHPEEAEERRKKEEELKRIKESGSSVDQEKFSQALKVSDIDWDLWEPTDRCVITYTEKDGKLLFIEKKKGMGAGYFNAPGGHIEEAETSSEAAIRETKEETGLDIKDPEFRGTLYFQFRGGIREIGYVFFAYGAEGTLKESDETRPFWVDKNAIPYENMWEDDKLWLPGALEGKKFNGYFIFDDKGMVDSSVEWLDEEE